ncbi:hypothetical protein [Pedobacter sp. SYSU D00535]|uniref:hypothetical protein n=1 Tax=Pedobacter sp. SYSU D00535 TaxID=2810308 RepID=UPI001A978B94|nr:hypothetical protein [Pedobacter sp. SYSU D00535]
MKTSINKIVQFGAKMTVILMLLSISLVSYGQNEFPERTTHAEQANTYLHNWEVDPNGVPNTSAWYVQPWIWSIVAAVLILVVAFFARGGGRQDQPFGSERGVRQSS